MIDKAEWQRRSFNRAYAGVDYDEKTSCLLVRDCYTRLRLIAFGKEANRAKVNLRRRQRNLWRMHHGVEPAFGGLHSLCGNPLCMNIGHLQLIKAKT